MKKFSVKRYLAGILSLCLFFPHVSYAFTGGDDLCNEHVKKLVLPKSYDFDDNGNVSIIKYNNAPKVWYLYDNKKQLIREDNSLQNQTITYAYDNRGNILNKTIYDFTCDDVQNKTPKTCVTYKYNQDDELVCYNGQKIIYDAHGNVIKYRDGWNFTWDNGKISEAVSPQSSAIYCYNNDGRRITKQVNNDLVNFDFTEDHLIQKNAQHTINWYLPGERGSKHFNCDGKDYSYICNLESDVIGIIDNNNQCVANYTYDSWGKLISITDEKGNDVTNNMDHIGNINPLRYRGYYYDNETGLYYIHARYYDPEVGRFLSKDDSKYLSEDFPNPYVYCMNNPVNMADYDGHGAITLAVCLAASDVAVAGTAALILASATAMMVLQPKIKEVVDKAIDWAVKSFITTGSAILAKFKELGEHLANMIGNLVKQYHVYLIKKKVPSSIKTPDGRVDLSKFSGKGPMPGKGPRTTKGPFGYLIVKDLDKHSGKAWKLLDSSLRRIASLSADGTILGR